MKKIIVSVLLLSTTCGLWAEVHLVGNLSPRLQEKLDRTLYKHPSWQECLKRMQDAFQKTGTPAAKVSLPTVLETNLDNYKETTYKNRLFYLQAQINKHKDLKGYRFAAPIPVDLAKLSQDNYEALSAFCQDIELAKVTQSAWVHPFTLSLHIRGISGGEVELWVDEPTKTIYLMSDNFFTTAASKYGLQELVK